MTVTRQDHQVSERDPVVPSSLQLADVLQVRCPVQAGAAAVLQPAPQLLPVHLQEVCEQHLVEDLAATQHLVQGGARAHVHQQLAADVS